MAREIHDQLGGDLTALKMDVTWLERHMPEDPALLQRTRQMIGMIDSTIQTVRQLAAELRPSVLDDLGLASALEWQLNEFQNRTGLECRLKADMKETRLSDEHATALFRLFQEALTNIARHAQATRVEVGLAQEDDAIRLEIADNGRGITPEAVKDPTAWGLIGMRERAALLSGRVDFEGSPDRGTTVVIRIPLK